MERAEPSCEREFSAFLECARFRPVGLYGRIAAGSLRKALPEKIRPTTLKGPLLVSEIAPSNLGGILLPIISSTNAAVLDRAGTSISSKRRESPGPTC